MKFPEELKYSKEHEWVRVEGDIVVIGVTDFAQGELGEIVYVDVETEGETLDKDAVFGSIEAVKTVSDLFMPIGGEIVEFNAELEDAPELVNEDPYGKGWMLKVKANNLDEINDLLTAEEYKKIIGK